MKIHRDLVQKSPEWIAARLGVVTASAVAMIVTPAKLEASKSIGPLIAELAAERILRMPCDDAKGPWMDRGTELESEARAWFAFHREPVEEVGFISSDDGRVGCSPDGIKEGAWGLEAKCPSAKVHVQYLLDHDLFRAYMPLQPQLGLWLTGWPLWYRMSYCPGMPTLVLEERPNPLVFDAFTKHIPPVLAKVDAAYALLVAMAK